MSEAETPLEALERWERWGGTWRLEQLLEPGAVVMLCTCDGQPVEQLRSTDPAFAARVAEPPSWQ
jgi:hypothetical protein